MTKPGAKREMEPKEEEQAKELASARAHILHEVVLREGEEESDRPVIDLLWSGLACGLSMGLSPLAEGAIRSALPESATWSRAVYSLGYPLGFLVAILGRQQLYTENTLTPVVPFLDDPGRESLARLLRIWGAVLVSNLLGATIIGAALATRGLLPDPIREGLLSVSGEAVGSSFGTTFFRGILGGWIIALLTWMLSGMKESGVSVIFLLTYALAAAGLTHVVAGTAEAAALLFHHAITWRAAAIDYVLPALLGNTVGGVVLVALLNHAQVHSGGRRGG